ncbi:MAG: hypothetical protein LBS45_08875 [Synergistaceae bacterium]|jgi:hypothetical protein|nr:hypothetical protein [Synergistaceae bacterium]
MGGSSSLFARIKMSRLACDKWLSSAIRHVPDYFDWHEMNPTAAAFQHELNDPGAKLDYMSVGEYLETLADSSRFFCCEFDDDESAFFIADAQMDGGLSGISRLAAFLAALRGAETFKDDDGPSFIYVFHALEGGDPDALLRIRRGESLFLRATDPSPDVLYFINEAEEFIETLAEDEE